MSETPLKTLGKYEIRKELGKGAMGVVYLGFDPALEREVALKVMASAIISDSELKDRFEREAKAVARLQHPNIVTVYDLGYDEGGAPFIAMEYLKGQDLEHRIRRDPLTFREKLSVVAQTCRGLSAAHRAGIVHRDIKPANVFLTESGEAKIMDFGVARWQASSHTQTGAVLGTADYMSPEQIRGHKIDGRSDIFSVGVILYRLLTSKKPFAGESIQSVFFKVLNQEPPELVLAEGNEMPELQAIVDKALAKSADDRYETADDLADDILDLMALYQGMLHESTVFETSFDPASTEAPSEPRSGARRPSTGTDRVFSTAGKGGVSRTHRPGQPYPATIAGRAVLPRPGQDRTSIPASTGRVDRTRVERGPVGIPIQPSRGVWKYVLAAALLAAAGAAAYLLVLPELQRGGEAVASATEPPPSVPTGPTVEQRLERARTAIDGGFLSTANNEVEAILIEHPDHVEALALQAEIETARQPPPAPVQPAATTSVPAGPSNAQRAANLAADASLAIGNGDLDGAEELIRQGRRLDPSSPRWQQLTGQLERARSESIAAAEREERQRIVDGLVNAGAEHLRNQEFEAAIAAYEQALEHDPTNVAAISGRNSAQFSLEQQRTAVTSLRFTESDTEFISASGGNDAPKGFETGGVEVQRATKAPANPAELIVNIRPTTVQPGDPYELEVRIYNEGHRMIGVKSLEIISTYGDQAPTGRGQQLTPQVQRINPQDTSLIWTARGKWTEAQKRGTIEAVVTLVGDAKLKKTVSWQ